MLFKQIFNDSPVSWQLTFQNPATPVMEGIINLHNYILMYEILVFVVVIWFLSRSLYLFSEKKHPEPKEFNHDPIIEAVWTIAPAFILIAIAVPSFSLLYSMDEVVDPMLTVKAIGHQWYWSYELDVSRRDNFFDYIEADIPKPKIRRTTDTPALIKLNKKLSAKPIKGFVKFKRHNPLQLYIKMLKKTGQVSYSRPRLFRLGFEVNKAQAAYSLEKSRLSLTDVLLKPVLELNPKQPLIYFKLFEFITREHLLKSSVEWVSPSVKFDSYMIPENELPFGGLRLLEVDNRLVLPVNTHIRLMVTSVDVIHSWAVPSLGIKVDGIPGRLNQTALYIKRPGVFYGQCSELCGVNHGFMPIVVEAVDFDQFIDWVCFNFTPTRLEQIVNSPDWEVKIN